MNLIQICVAPATLKFAGKVMTNLPSAGTGFAVVKVAVAAPEAPATKLAGTTPALMMTPGVIILCCTLVSVSMSVAAAVLVVMVKFPVAPEITGFFILVNAITCVPAAQGFPPERLIVRLCPETVTDKVPSNPPLLLDAAGVPVKS